MRRGWATTAGIFALSVSAGAIAASLDREADFDIPAQQLDTALLAYSRQSGVQVIAASEALTGKMAPAVQGIASARAALTALLNGSGLAFASVTDDTVTIVLAQSSVSPRSQQPSNNGQTPGGATGFTGPAQLEEEEKLLIGRDDHPRRVEEVVVTGSRIRSTFNSSTPVTVTSAEDLRQSAPNNLADALNQLPAFAPSTRTDITVTSATGGTNGQNLLNLRNLGANRNLILLDGRRLPATNFGGSVDVNVMPQGLVSRVDVVTGGASAVYGSDAVSGVVNFILDTRFEGEKGETGGGVSSYGDLPSGHLSLAFGHEFSDRLHIIASAEAFGERGVGATSDSHRAWFEQAAGQIPNPVVGATPAILVIPDIRSSVGTAGGVITSGPLKGIQFLAGGITAPFNYGTITGSSFQCGGDGAKPKIAFAPDQLRANVFLHGEVEASDDVTVFGEVHYAYTHVASDNQVNPQTGIGNQFTIFAENAFLPAPVSAAMAAAGATSFTLGRYEADFPVVQIDALLRMTRFVGGAKAKIGDWNFDVSATHGVGQQEVAERNLTLNRRLYAAADAVRDPVTGQVVCRSTLLYNLDSGCVPLNLFGAGAPSAAAIRYVTGDSIQYLIIKQDVVAANFSGDLGSWSNVFAGPVSMATGLEYRNESANSAVDPFSPLVTDFTGVRGGPSSQQGRPGSFNFYNPSPLHGSYNIEEGYLELGLPLVKDRPLAKSLDVDLAARTAQYSQSGNVITWKAGFNYLLSDQYRLRFTESRDIRGPNILELFNPATQNSNNQVYQGKTTPSLTISSGNPELHPERALTTTFGAVWRPAWLSGLEVSADYYDISINGAIGALNGQNTLDSCAQGNALACAQVTVTDAGTLIIHTAQMNLSVAKTSGIDFEAAYRADVWNGQLTVRLLANHIIEDYTQAPGALPVPRRGTAASPYWRANLQANFAVGPWTTFIQERFISRSLFDPTKVEGIDTNLNHAPAVLYTDLNLIYHVDAPGDEEVFVSVTNVFDRDPPIYTINPTSFSQPTSGVYDRSGRYFNAGVRFHF